MSNKENDIIFEQEAEFKEEEHSGGQHKTFTEDCPMCFSESKVLKGYSQEFSFENVIKMVGNINKVLYNVNPYE